MMIDKPYEFDFSKVADMIFTGCSELKDPLSDTQMLAISAALYGVQSALKGANR